MWLSGLWARWHTEQRVDELRWATGLRTQMTPGPLQAPEGHNVAIWMSGDTNFN